MIDAKSSKNGAIVLALGVASLLSATAASASVIYTNRAAWTAATTSIANVDFEGIAPFNTPVYQGSSTTIGGVTFTNPSGMYVIDAAYAESGGTFCLGTGDCLFGYSSGITGLPGPTTSIGFDLRGYLEASTTFNITLSNGETYIATVSNPVGGFWGVTTGASITSVHIDQTTDYMIIDNFSFGTSSSVPEPASLAILALGLLGLGWSRRKSA